MACSQNPCLLDCKQVLRNSRCALAENIRNNVCKLNVGYSQTVLSTILFADVEVGDLNTITR
jgi:hypothetical protein